MSDSKNAQPEKKKSRSGSEQRQRQSIIGVRVYEDERELIKANAAAVDLCESSFLRVLGTATRRPHERRRRLPELKPFSQAMGRLGIYASNAHQLLKIARRGEILDVPELRETVENLNAASDALLKIINLET
jgi:hypothetical protein